MALIYLPYREYHFLVLPQDIKHCRRRTNMSCEEETQSEMLNRAEVRQHAITTSLEILDTKQRQRVAFLEPTHSTSLPTQPRPHRLSRVCVPGRYHGESNVLLTERSNRHSPPVVLVGHWLAWTRHVRHQIDGVHD